MKGSGGVEGQRSGGAEGGERGAEEQGSRGVGRRERIDGRRVRQDAYKQRAQGRYVAC
jgi:hypothetical protein